MSVTRPRDMDPEAKKFWDKHAPSLIEEGLLTERTACTFELLARTWGQMQAIDFVNDQKSTMKWIGLYKQFTPAARQFGMQPVQAKKDNVGLKVTEPDEFGIS